MTAISPRQGLLSYLAIKQNRCEIVALRAKRRLKQHICVPQLFVVFGLKAGFGIVLVTFFLFFLLPVRAAWADPTGIVPLTERKL